MLDYTFALSGDRNWLLIFSSKDVLQLRLERLSYLLNSQQGLFWIQAIERAGAMAILEGYTYVEVYSIKGAYPTETNRLMSIMAFVHPNGQRITVENHKSYLLENSYKYTAIVQYPSQLVFDAIVKKCGLFIRDTGDIFEYLFGHLKSQLPLTRRMEDKKDL